MQSAAALSQPQVFPLITHAGADWAGTFQSALQAGADGIRLYLMCPGLLACRLPLDHKVVTLCPVSEPDICSYFSFFLIIIITNNNLILSYT
jgi:hypothetical protein